MTEASAYMLSTLSSAHLGVVMAQLFKPGAGAGISIMRVPMGATDQSLTDYTYDDMPAGQTDPTLAHFSVAHDDTIIVPIIKQALALNPNIKITALPWSAPAWMTTGDTLFGSSFNPTYYNAFAQYFVKFIQAYQSRGIPIWAVSPQNEPQNANAAYPTMLLSAAQEADFVGGYLGPALVQAGLNHVKIIGYEHNWDTASYPLQLLGNATAYSYLAGTAFHCYAGEPSAQSTVESAYPNKGIWFTECTGTFSSANFASNLGYNATTLIMGVLQNWGRSILLWNIALDPNGNPHIGGCSNCRGVITISSGTVTQNVEFATLAQLADAAEVGAVLISSGTSNSAVSTVAFANPDSTHGIIIYNSGQTAQTVAIQDANGQNFSTSILAGAVLSLRYP